MLSLIHILNCAATKTRVLCLRLEDKPGELARVLKVLSSCGINVQYSYSLISTYICLYVKDLDQAEKLLADQPVELLDQKDFLYMTADIA